MSHPLSSLDKREPGRSAIFLALLFIWNVAIHVILYRQGFLSVSADEFGRGILAAQWAGQPRIDILADLNGVWLPLEKYLNGLLLIIWRDPILAPRATVLIASCVFLAAFFALVYYLFREFAVAALAAVLVAFQPWFVWLSGTPMLEMYYFACFFSGLVLLVIWLREDRRAYWLGAACCFAVATGFHVQAWTFINLVNLLTIGYLYRFGQQRMWGRMRRLFAFYVGSNLVIIVYGILQAMSGGSILGFLGRHTTYSKIVYGGYNVPISEKLLYYPRIAIEHSSGVLWLLLAVALAFLWRDRDRLIKLLPLALAALALALNSIMNVFSGPPSAAPARYSLFYVILIAPYAAYGAYYLVRWGLRWRPRLMGAAPAVLAAALLLYGIYWGAVRIGQFPRGMSRDAVQIGQRLSAILDQATVKDSDTCMVELRYWDYLAVELTAGHFDRVLLDREYSNTDRHKPSLFAQSPADIGAALTRQKVAYIVLFDPELKAKVQSLGSFLPVQTVGGWTIYAFKPEGYALSSHSSR